MKYEWKCVKKFQAILLKQHCDYFLLKTPMIKFLKLLSSLLKFPQLLFLTTI